MSNFNEPINKLNKDLYQKRLNEKYPNKFEIIGEYISSSENTDIKCLVCNHIFNIRPASLMSRGRCPNCVKNNKIPRVNTWNKLTHEEFIDKVYNLVKDEYTVLSTYTKAEDYVLIRHNKCGYEWNVQARNFISPSQLSRCPKCMRFHSNKEDSVHNFIKSIYNGNIIRNTRKVIFPLELDIYIPDKNLAIEFNGTYWHNSDNKDRNYHFNKSKMCEEKGIRLIHIWEYEWDNKRQRPILENIIKNALGINENKIYARKLDIEVRPSKEMKDFFDKNNIQGFRPGKFAICLVDKETKEVYMAYMFGHCYFGKGKYECEVIRGATKLGYTVVGGASKIWKYFTKNYNYNNCVYYVDYNYFNGNSLPYLGLEYITVQPSFKNYFVEDGVIRNRDPIHHKEIKELEKQGLVIPIYNAGSKVYVWNRN